MARMRQGIFVGKGRTHWISPKAAVASLSSDAPRDFHLSVLKYAGGRDGARISSMHLGCGGNHCGNRGGNRGGFRVDFLIFEVDSRMDFGMESGVDFG